MKTYRKYKICKQSMCIKDYSINLKFLTIRIVSHFFSRILDILDIFFFFDCQRHIRVSDESSTRWYYNIHVPLQKRLKKDYAKILKSEVVNTISNCLPFGSNSSSSLAYSIYFTYSSFAKTRGIFSCSTNRARALTEMNSFTNISFYTSDRTFPLKTIEK